ncbi:MAG: hypothetical protein OEX02_14495 [Cyclobacteriaceae bacterium]|nr:hypothetical protein [Cyclobacteriaceae bacterium]
MNSRELDELFKQKLDNYHRKPSDAAWERINRKDSKKQAAWVYYLAVAASLFLIATMSYFFFAGDNISPEGLVRQDVTHTTPLSPEKDPEKSSPEQLQIPTTQSTQTNEPLAQSAPNEKSTSGTENMEKVLKNAKEQKVSTGEELEDARVMTAYQPKELIAVDDATTNPDVLDMDKISGITTLDEMRDGFLSVRNDDATIATEQIVTTEVAREENTRGLNLKRMVQAAREFKNDNGSWEALREAKNDLLALGRGKKENNTTDENE